MVDEIWRSKQSYGKFTCLHSNACDTILFLNLKENNLHQYITSVAMLICCYKSLALENLTGQCWKYKSKS